MPAPRDFTDHHFDVLGAEAALDALDDACAVVARDWRIVFANAAFLRLSNVPHERVTGGELWAVLPPLADPEPAGILRATMLDGERRACRLATPVAAQAVYEMRASGLPGGLSVQLRDISETVRSEQELAERIEENVSLREVARVLAAEVDLSALLRVICREAMAQCDAAGATVGEVEGGDLVIVAGAGIGQAAHGHRFPMAGSLTERAVAARAPVSTDNYYVEHPRQAAAFAALNAPILMGIPLVAHDEVLGVLMVLRRTGSPPFAERDARRIRAIADHAALAVWKTRLLEQVQEANRAKSEFMATMSHELRTPLTALTGYEELLADEVLGPLSGQQRAAIDRMRSSIELLTVIIDEILTFSRLEAGEVPVHAHETTAQEIVAAAGAVIEPLARDKRLELTLVTPEAPLGLVTDADMVRRILVNLGANAVKFTERGSVAIEAAAAGDDVTFVVRDTGIGIAETDLPRLFQPFTQLESGFTRRYGGTGLGLFIAQRLAGLLGGVVTVASEVGVGSAFTLRIPRERRRSGDSGA